MKRPNTCSNLIKAVNALTTVRDKGPLLPTVAEAVDWTNRLVARIAAAVRE